MCQDNDSGSIKDVVKGRRAVRLPDSLGGQQSGPSSVGKEGEKTGQMRVTNVRNLVLPSCRFKIF